MNEGAVITQPGNSVKNKTGGWRSLKPSLDQKKCIKCGNCWVNCPASAIDKKKGIFVINYDMCKGCGICARECPVKAIILVKEEK